MESWKLIGIEMDTLEQVVNPMIYKTLIRWYIWQTMQFKKMVKIMANSNKEIRFHILSFKDTWIIHTQIKGLTFKKWLLAKWNKLLLMS